MLGMSENMTVMVYQGAAKAIEGWSLVLCKADSDAMK